MEILLKTFGIVLLCLTINAAPSDRPQVDDIAVAPAVNEENVASLDQVSSHGEQSKRDKRWFDPYTLGHPPMNPVLYPSHYQKRDDSHSTGTYGLDDPFTHIFNKLNDIASVVKSSGPPPPPRPQHAIHAVPILFPVIYIPRITCSCNNDINGRLPPTDQVWGTADNETPVVEGPDFENRPISLDPAKPIRPPSRPLPPVEHGSSQGDINSVPEQAPNNNNFPSPPSTQAPQEIPSVCDSAVISCCHRPEVRHDCFTAMGCNPTSLGEPCSYVLISKAIRVFQRFYGPFNDY